MHKFVDQHERESPADLLRIRLTANAFPHPQMTVLRNGNYTQQVSTGIVRAILSPVMVAQFPIPRMFGQYTTTNKLHRL